LRVSFVDTHPQAWFRVIVSPFGGTFQLQSAGFHVSVTASDSEDLMGDVIDLLQLL